MTKREARRWAHALALAAAAALLALAVYAVESGVSDCERHGGHYDGATGCTTPSGVQVPHS